MNTPPQKGQIHEEIEKIFQNPSAPRNGLAVREEQVCPSVTSCWMPCSKNNIALCDAGVGIGKTYAYLTGLHFTQKKRPHRAVGSPAGSGFHFQYSSARRHYWGVYPFFIPHFSGESHHSEAHPEPSYAKAKNDLYAISALPSGWKPWKTRKRTMQSNWRPCFPFALIMIWTP